MDTLLPYEISPPDNNTYTETIHKTLPRLALSSARLNPRQLCPCRKTHFHISDDSGNCQLLTRLQHKGVPQGGVLSPFLFSLYVTDITKNIPSSTSALQYADDIAIYAANNSLNSTISTETTVTTIMTNLGHLEVFPNKTELVIFNGKHNPSGIISLQIGHHHVSNHESAKFLDIHIDQKLNFHQLATEIHTRTRKVLNPIKVLRGISCGDDSSMLLLVYKTLICCRIDYGLHIYFPLSKLYNQKLESIQIAAARLALGFRKTTPTC